LKRFFPAEEGGYVALNPETGTTTQGETVEEAIANLREATARYLSAFSLPSLGHPLVATFTVSKSAQIFDGRYRSYPSLLLPPSRKWSTS